MITASVQTEGRKLTGFRIEGHSGLAEAGEDILCAAVTSAVRLTECAINDVLGLEAGVKMKPEKALLSLKLPAGLSQSNDSFCQNLLTGLMLYLSQLQEEYPENIIVMEV